MAITETTRSLVLMVSAMLAAVALSKSTYLAVTGGGGGGAGRGAAPGRGQQRLLLLLGLCC